jgi:replication factor A1
MNPDIPEAHILRGWFDTIGKNSEPQSISQQGMNAMATGASGRNDRKLISQIKDENLGMGDKVNLIQLADVCSPTI